MLKRKSMKKIGLWRTTKTFAQERIPAKYSSWFPYLCTLNLQKDFTIICDVSFLNLT